MIKWLLCDRRVLLLCIMCMWLNVCFTLCVWMRAWLYVCGCSFEHGGQRRILYILHTPFGFPCSANAANFRAHNSLSWLANMLHTSSSVPNSSRIIDLHTMSNVFVSAGDLTSGPHAYITNTLHSGPILQDLTFN